MRNLRTPTCFTRIKMVKITNQEQIKTLIELMEQNPQLATNFRRGVSQTEDKKKEWTAVSNKLNSLGPPVRTDKEWQKVWFDAKFKVKQKLLYNKKQMEVTGGGPFRQKYLNDSDKAIADLLQLNHVVDPEGMVFGGCEQQVLTSSVPSSSSTAVVTSTEEVLLELNDSNTIYIAESTGAQNPSRENLPTNNTSTSTHFTEMVERQTNAQESLYFEVKEALKKIEGHLKESARYERKRFHLEEEKLELYKLNTKRGEEQQKKENEMRVMDLELKKRKLDLKERKFNFLEQPNVED